MAHGTYNNPRAGSTASALRMQEMVNNVNGKRSKQQRLQDKSDRLHNKSQEALAKGKKKKYLSLDYRSAKAYDKSQKVIENKIDKKKKRYGLK